MTSKVYIQQPAGLGTSSENDASPPPSIISSRMTDIASQDGDNDSLPTEAQSNAARHSIRTGGDGRSRPGTATTASSRGPWTSPPSRRGAAAIQRNSIRSNAGSNRPQSAARTHVPSISQHAFFRPMSSQRLQAQRGVRPASRTQLAGSEEGSNDGTTPRQSQFTNVTTFPEDEQPPPSRGTEMTEPVTDGRMTSTASPPPGHGGHASLSESERPLQGHSSNLKGLTLDMGKSFKSNIKGPLTPVKSPRSFRASFLLPSRGDHSSNSPSRNNRNNQGGEKLLSVSSSPAPTSTRVPRNYGQRADATSAKLGRNYQYFPGNTRFWAGGRLQNARDRPVNIATGLFAILPGVLFFIFSASWLWHNVSPAVPIIFAYLFYICISSFIHASVTDPGVSFHRPSNKKKGMLMNNRFCHAT